MGIKVNILLQSIEFLLVVYVLLDVYDAISSSDFDDNISPEDIVVGSNGTNGDPKVAEVGKFAVDEYNNLANENLKFQAVVKALYARSSYMLLIQVMDGMFSESRQYVASVENQGNRMSLVGFEEYMESVM